MAKEIVLDFNFKHYQKGEEDMMAEASSFTIMIPHVRMILAILAVLILGVVLVVWLNGRE